MIAISGLLSGYLFIIKATAQKPATAPAAKDEGTDHHLFAALYTTKGGWTSTLALNNPLGQSRSVRVTLYNKHGQALVVPVISMSPNQNRYFNIAEWLSKADANGFSEGSMEIFFHGPPMGMGGQLVITDEHHSLSFDVPFAESEMFASSQLESLWWSLESKSKAEVFLANTKTERMTITPTFYINGEALASEPVILEAHESETLDIGRALNRLNVSTGTIRGGITLRHDRQPGALAVAGAITGKQSGFSTTMRFVDVRAQHSTKLYGAHLLIGKSGTQAGFTASTSFAPHVTVRNTTTQPVHIQGRVLYTTKDDSRSVEITPLTLAANEVRALNLSAVIASVGTKRLSDAGIEIEYTGGPGAIVVALASVDQSRRQVFDTPLRDPKSLNFGGGSYPFRIDGDNRAVIHLKNIDPVTNGEPRLCEVHLMFKGVDYTLPAQRVEAGQTLAIDIKKLRDEQVPDGSGKVIPQDAM